MWQIFQNYVSVPNNKRFQKTVIISRATNFGVPADFANDFNGLNGYYYLMLWSLFACLDVNDKIEVLAIDIIILAAVGFLSILNSG